MELFCTGVIIETEQMFHVLTAGRVLAPSFHSAFLDENKQFWLASSSSDIWLTVNSVIGLAAGGSGDAESRWGWPRAALMPIAPTQSLLNEPQPGIGTCSWGALVWTPWSNACTLLSGRSREKKMGPKEAWWWGGGTSRLGGHYHTGVLFLLLLFLKFRGELVRVL